MPGVQKCRLWLSRTLPSLPNDPTHPAQVALRTYALALSLSSGPALIPLVSALASAKKPRKATLSSLNRVIKRELGYDGFAFSMTTAVAGAAMLRHLWTSHIQGPGTERVHEEPSTPDGRVESLKRWLRSLKPTSIRTTFIFNIISSSVAVALLQKGAQAARKANKKKAANGSVQDALASPTLNLTLLLVVRALDSVVQSLILKTTRPGPRSLKPSPHSRNVVEPVLVREKLEREEAKRVNQDRQRITEKVDAFLFWVCSSRIMWCFFYEPHRLPLSYVKWIYALANLDERIPQTLRLLRTSEWSYINGSQHHSNLLEDCIQGMGLPASWGNPTHLPAYGGAIANTAWKKLTVTNRPGVGGLPCEVVHGRVGRSLGLQGNCHANAGLRGLKAFSQALLIYAPAHFIPVLLTRPKTLLRPARLISIVAGTLRSTTFLASFISLYWYTVCLSRSVVLARLLPFISHDFWDGPYGAVLYGSLACGASIWIENGRRRGEMALYVLPRALRTCLPEWVLRNHAGKSHFIEKTAFILSMSTLLSAAVHRPDSLRGLSRWALAFIMNGPSAGFWKRKRRDPSIPPTPSATPTPYPSKDLSTDQDIRTVQ